MKSVTKTTDDVFVQKVSMGSNVNLEVSKRDVLKLGSFEFLRFIRRHIGLFLHA